MDAFKYRPPLLGLGFYDTKLRVVYKYEVDKGQVKRCHHRVIHTSVLRLGASSGEISPATVRNVSAQAGDDSDQEMVMEAPQEEETKKQ